MLIGGRLRTAVEAVGVADPVSVPHRYTAPLVAVQYTTKMANEKARFPVSAEKRALLIADYFERVG